MSAWTTTLWVLGALVLCLALVSAVRAVLHRAELARDTAAERARDLFHLPAQDAPASEVLDEDTITWPTGKASYLHGAEVDKQEAAGIIGSAQRQTVVEPIVVDARVIPRLDDDLPPARPRRRMITVVDELGTWEPWAHQPAEPLILGDVLAWRKWKTVRPHHVGMASR